MKWLRAASVSLDVDLANMSAYLYQQGIAHRITEESDTQVIWVQQAAKIEAVQDLVNRIARGELQIDVKQRQAKAGETSAVPLWFVGLRLFPVTLFLMLLSIVGAALVEWDYNLSIVRWLTFQDVSIVNRRPQLGDLGLTLSTGQYWRLITPIFLHFGLFHILFNGLWLWEFGRRLEVFMGGRQFVGLVLIVGLASNLLQYAWGGPSLFGGMSGVLYGLLGFLWIRHRRAPHPLLNLPKGIIVFMLLWLVLAATGAVNIFIDGQVANAAHVGGLLAGIILAWLPGHSAQAQDNKRSV